MAFLEKYNVDEVFLRGVIVGLLRSLNEKVTYTQINEKQEILQIFIPFFYSMSGDESFLQDFYLNYFDCNGESPFAEGNYDVIPRGIVNLSGVDIQTGALTNGFVRTTYNVETTTGEMKALSAYTNSIPLAMTFDLTLRADTLLDTFKIFQSVISTFYKVYDYSFEYGGQRIPVQVGFPEVYPNDKQLEFSYASTQKWIETKFTIQVETYYPQKDLQTERFRGNLMQAGIRLNLLFDGVSGVNPSFFGGLPSTTKPRALPPPGAPLPSGTSTPTSGNISVSQVSGYYVPQNSDAVYSSMSFITGSGKTDAVSNLTYINVFPLSLQNRVLGQNLFINVTSSDVNYQVVPVGVTENSVLIFESPQNDLDFYFTGIYI